MFKINHRPLKNKKDPQQFLQYGIGENKFKMILVNEPNASFVPVVAPKIPPGFKPLSSSTPKRSRKSFEIIDKPVTKLPSPAPRLKMSQFIGEIPNPSEKSQNTRSSNKKNINFVKPASKSFETSIIANDINSTVHLKRQRSTSCQSWESFQKQLRQIFNTTVNDLNTTEKILKLTLQFNSHSNKNKSHKQYQDENLKIFENYVKIEALKKAFENVDDWNKCTEKFLDGTESDEDLDLDKNNQFELSSKNVGSFKVPQDPLFSKPGVKPISNDSEIIIENEIITTKTANKSTEPCTTSILEFSSFSKKNNSQKNQTNEVFKSFENFFDSKISTKVSKTIDDFSFFEQISSDSIETEEVFDNNRLMLSSKNFESFKVPEVPVFSKTKKPKNSCLKIKRIQSHNKVLASPYFDFNEMWEQNQASSQFEEELQKLIKTTTRSDKKQKKIFKAPLHTKPAINPSKDFEINISNDITTANGKPQLRSSFADVNTTENILKWIFQHNSSSKNCKNEKNHPEEVFKVLENLVDGNISTMVSKTVDDLSIFKETCPFYQ